MNTHPLRWPLLTVLLFCGISLLTAGTRRYRLSWVDNPATSISIGFEFNLGRQVYVAYDTKPGGVNVSAYRFRANPSRTQLVKGMRTCFVRLTDLQPETVYYFIVVDDQGISRPLSFETPPNRLDRRLSIIAGGDSRNHREARQTANHIVGKLRPHAVFFSGDMTESDTPAQWAAWLDDWQLTISEDGRCTPIVPARGNHEQANTSISQIFDVPHPDIYYALDFAGGLLRAYTLNTMVEANGNQLQWLNRDLQTNQDVVWKVVQYHNGMRPHSAGKVERDDLVKFWAPLFYRHEVNLAIESDAHVVKRTWPLRPSQGPGSELGFIRDDAKGTVYVGEGCWGAPLRTNDDNKSWTRASGRFNQFKWLWIDASKIELRTVMTDGSASCATVNPNQRFEVPRGLRLWRPNNEDVLTIRKGRAVASTAPPPARTPIRPSQPVFQPTGGGPPAPGANPVTPPSTVEVIRPNDKFKVELRYVLDQPGPVEVIIITDKLRQFHKRSLPAKGPGPYREWVQIPEIPRSIKWQLILKSRGKVIKRFKLVN
ncbi:MAG: metallophosphoesterase family protein [Bacteroidota bacterium]